MLPDLLYIPSKGTITLHILEEPVYYYYSRVRDTMSALKCLKMTTLLLFKLLSYVLHTSIIGHCQCVVLSWPSCFMSSLRKVPISVSFNGNKAVIAQPKFSSFTEVPQPELMLTTTRGRATVAGLDSSQEYTLQVLVLNGTTEKLLAKRRFTSKKCS